MAQPEPKAAQPEQAVAVRKDIVDSVMTRIEELQNGGRLHFPPNYSPGNALMSAWLILQSTKDKNDKPVLQTCSRDSIYNTLLDMVVQGLNPVKKQCYFIAYGSALACQRSYFGTALLAKRIAGAKDVHAEVVYEDDEFEYSVARGGCIITKHARKLANVDRTKIVAAYCTVIRPGDEDYVQVMSMDEIKQAWRKSQTKPVDEKGQVRPDSTHGQFTADMAKKTVINHTCKMFVNTSDDSSLDLVLEHMNRADEAAEEAAFAAEREENANGVILEADVREVEDDVSRQAPQTTAAAQEPGW